MIPTVYIILPPVDPVRTDVLCLEATDCHEGCGEIFGSLSATGIHIGADARSAEMYCTLYKPSCIGRQVKTCLETPFFNSMLELFPVLQWQYNHLQHPISQKMHY